MHTTQGMFDLDSCLHCHHPQKKGIKIATHILSCGGVFDRSFEDINSDIDSLNTMEFAVLDSEKAQAMQAQMQNYANLNTRSIQSILPDALPQADGCSHCIRRHDTAAADRGSLHIDISFSSNLSFSLSRAR